MCGQVDEYWSTYPGQIVIAKGRIQRGNALQTENNWHMVPYQWGEKSNSEYIRV